MRRRILAGLAAVIGAASLAVTAHASFGAFALTAAPAASTSAHTAAAPAYTCNIQGYLTGQCPPPRLCIHGPCPDGATASTTATAAAPAAAITCVNSPLIPVDPCRVICPHCMADTAAPATTATAAAPAPASSPAYVCTLQAMLAGTCKPAICAGHMCPMVDLTPTSVTAAPAATVRLGR